MTSDESHICRSAGVPLFRAVPHTRPWLGFRGAAVSLPLLGPVAYPRLAFSWRCLKYKKTSPIICFSLYGLYQQTLAKASYRAKPNISEAGKVGQREGMNICIKGWHTVSIKSQIVNISNFAGHIVSCCHATVLLKQESSCRQEIRAGGGCVLIKRYLWNQGADRIWLKGHGFFTHNQFITLGHRVIMEIKEINV